MRRTLHEPQPCRVKQCEASRRAAIASQPCCCMLTTVLPLLRHCPVDVRSSLSPLRHDVCVVRIPARSRQILRRVSPAASAE